MSFLEEAAQETNTNIHSVMSTSQQWDEMQRNRESYQASLRMIGAFLDENDARNAHIMETVDGFTIRYQRVHEGMKLYTHKVKYADVLKLTAEVERKRKRNLFGFGSRQPDPTTGRYENTLRALGYELDTAQAYSLLIDEVDEGFLVTYQYLNPTQGFMVRKRMVFLNLHSIEHVLSDAYARRQDSRRGLLTLLAG